MATTDADSSSAPEQIEERIGPYHVLGAIGEGGFGTVYDAEQIEPVRRRVALKVLKLGMDTKSVVARFEAERQALALMDHPNIAKVLDAGATPSGRPYFAMELVHGIPITDYCGTNRLGTRQRLQLFETVCRAVQHAHQKGIIHRDLKPGNILVSDIDGQPVPKVIDFGIAKATTASLTEKTVYTQRGQFIGTPQYMSPEQAEMSGLDIDTRTDVYSLGAVLYELLADEPPFDAETIRKAGALGVQKLIREVEPERPSTRVRTATDVDSAAIEEIARRRGTEPSTLLRELRGDLDWITMKALEKDRTRRYETASDLAEDVQRHLSYEPVLARPASTAYRVSRFARRHRAGVSLGVVVLLALVAGAAAAWAGWLAALDAEAEARRERDSALAETARAEAAEGRANDMRALAETRLLEAETARRQAEASESLANEMRALAEERLDAVNEAREQEQLARARAEYEAERGAAVQQFLVDTLGVADATVPLDDLTLQGLLDQAALRVGPAFAAQPDAEARVRTVLGRAYLRLGDTAAAGPQLRRAVELFDDLEAPPADLREPLQGLLGVTAELDLSDSFTIFRRYYLLLPALLQERHPELAAIATSVDWSRRETVESGADRMHLAAGRLLAEDDPAWSVVREFHLISGLGFTEVAPEFAEREVRRALDVARRTLPAQDLETALVLGILVNSLLEAERYTEAEEAVRESLGIQREILGDTHTRTLRLTLLLVYCLVGQGRLDEASTEFERVVVAVDEGDAGLGPLRVETRRQQLEFALDRGVRADVLAAREALRNELLFLPTSHPELHELLAFGEDEQHLAEPYGRLLDLAVADRLPRGQRNVEFERALDELAPGVHALPADSPLAAIVARRLCLLSDEEEAWLDSFTRGRLVQLALPIARDWKDRWPSLLAAASYELADLASETDRWEDVESLARQAWELHRKGAEADALTARYETMLGMALTQLGRYEEAERHLASAHEVTLARLGSRSVSATDSWNLLVSLYAAWGRPERIEPWVLEQALSAEDVRASGGLAVLVAHAPATAAALEEFKAVAPGAAMRPKLHALIDARRSELPDEDPVAVIVAEALLSMYDWIRHNLGSAAFLQPAVEDAARVCSAALGTDHPKTIRAHLFLAIALVENEHFEQAERVAGPLVALLDVQRGSDSVWTANARAILGRALVGQDRHVEGEVQLGRALSVLLARADVGSEQTMDGVWGVVRLAEATGRTSAVTEMLVPALERLVREGSAPQALVEWATALTFSPALESSHYELAVEAARLARTLPGAPPHCPAVEGLALVRLGRFEEGAEKLLVAANIEELPRGISRPLIDPGLVMALTGLGHVDEAQRLLEGLRELHRSDFISAQFPQARRLMEQAEAAVARAASSDDA